MRRIVHSGWDTDEEATIDRLSNLPDGMIHHILSFVDARLAVQTSVLSKRWIHLWINIPVLNFYSREFPGKFSFENFIRQFLKRHNASTIHTLRFQNLLKLDQSLVANVVKRAVSRNVLHINFRFFSWYSTDFMKHCSLRKKSLRTLKLESCQISPTFFYFPVLLSLALYNVGSNTEYLLIDNISKCVGLESLELDKCCVKWFIPANLNFPFLKTLNILRNLYRFVQSEDVWHSPKLHTVHLHTMTQCCISKESMEVYLPKLVNIFKMLSNARSLNLTFDTIKVLSRYTDMLHNQVFPFEDLEILKVQANIKQGKNVQIPVEVLRYLLSGSPKLKDLVVVLPQQRQ
ncbi:hypothetical protein ACFE04_024928 [Oxalis oulophora]